MSHMTLEYSGNLQADGRFDELCRKLARYMCDLRVDDEPVFPPGGVRVRALLCNDYCIADGSLRNAGFVHAILKIGAGRSGATQQMVCNGLFEIIKAHFGPPQREEGLALSLEFTEFSESGTLKDNNLHEMLKNAVR